MRFVDLVHGRKRAQVNPERAQIYIGQPGVGGIGKARVIVFAMWALAFTQRPDEVCLAPATDAGFVVRRDVGGIKSTERRVQFAPPGQAGAIVFTVSMAIFTARQLVEIFALRHRYGRLGEVNLDAPQAHRREAEKGETCCDHLRKSL